MGVTTQKQTKTLKEYVGTTTAFGDTGNTQKKKNVGFLDNEEKYVA